MLALIAILFLIVVMFAGLFMLSLLAGSVLLQLRCRCLAPLCFFAPAVLVVCFALFVWPTKYFISRAAPPACCGRVWLEFPLGALLFFSVALLAAAFVGKRLIRHRRSA